MEFDKVYQEVVQVNEQSKSFKKDLFECRTTLNTLIKGHEGRIERSETDIIATKVKLNKHLKEW